MTNRLYWILVCAFFLAFVLLLLFLNGCSGGAKKASSRDIIWHKDGCLLMIDGNAVSTSDDDAELWKFSDCGVEIEQYQNKPTTRD